VSGYEIVLVACALIAFGCMVGAIFQVVREVTLPRRIVKELAKQERLAAELRRAAEDLD
jgi:hypothetical protein